MQSGKSIVNLPLLIGVVLSVAIHVMALYSRGIYTPPKVKMEAGRTVVQLTLIPSAASQAAAPEPPPPEPVEEPKPEPEVTLPIEPAPAPVPEPVVAPKPEPAQEPAPEPRPQETLTPEPAPPPIQEAATVNSIEQNATMLEDKGVATEAAASTAIQPKYPRISQRRNEQGDVTLLVQVLASGKPGTVRVAKSSGHKRLDEAALKAVEKATFEPARKFGQAVDSETEITITFKLTDE